MSESGAARIVIVGNSGGGKSTLARRFAVSRHLPLIEVDTLLWQPGWQVTPVADYEHAHDHAIARPAWIIDGLGRKESLPGRLGRATEIILIDMPLDVHIRLATERNAAWEAGTLAHPPAMIAEAPSLKAMLANIDVVDRIWMPDVRRWIAGAGAAGAAATRIGSVEELNRFGA